MFGNDTQLNHSDSPDSHSDLVHPLQDRVKDIMDERELKLNNDKIEAICFSASFSVNITLQLPHTIYLRNTETELSGVIRNLSFTFDSDTSMKQNIIKTCVADQRVVVV